MTIIPLADKKSGCDCCQTPAWLTLPVAPQAAARCRFSREEKLPQAIPLSGAMTWVEDLQARGMTIAGLDLNGPGDPLASLPLSLEIVDQLRAKHPGLAFAITTLGLGLTDTAAQVAKHGVGKITLLMDALSPEVVQQLYAWIRPGKRTMPLNEAAATLISEQTTAITACCAAGLAVVVQTTVYNRVNEGEVEEIARLAAGLGAEAMTLLPGKGWLGDDEQLPLPAPEVMARLRESAARHLPVVEAPQGDSLTAISRQECGGTSALPTATSSRPNVAVLSSNGMDIDLHLGQAIKALIYGPRADGLACLLAARDLPEPGGGASRWQQVAEILDDCFVLLAENAGQTPRQILSDAGLPIVLIADNVEGTVDVLFGGGKKGRCRK